MGHFNKQDYKRESFMLDGSFKRKGYDWWWHSFTAINEKTKEERPFFIEFFIVNPSLAKDTPTLGQSKENKENHVRPSYLMVKCGCWGEEKIQLHRFVSLKNVKINKCPFQVESDDLLINHDTIKGSVSVTKEDIFLHPEMMCDAGSMSFDVKLDKKVSFNVGYGASAFFRFIKAFEMYWHAEGMKSFVSGTVTLNGEKYDVIPEKSYGYCDKNWGRGFTSPWVWLSSHDLYSNVSKKKLNDSVFDIGGGRPKIYFAALNRQLLSAFYYEGKEIEFNFSKFWEHVKTQFDFKEDEEKVYWTVIQTNRHYKMETHVTCLKKDMLFVNYEDPEGNKRHNKLYNGGNGTGNVKLYGKNKNQYELIDDIDVKHIGCEYGEYDK